jgi:hypothetical protein
MPDAGDRPMGRWLAVGINIVLRVALVAFLADAILNADDPRFAGKGIENSASPTRPSATPISDGTGS